MIGSGNWPITDVRRPSNCSVTALQIDKCKIQQFMNESHLSKLY